MHDGFHTGEVFASAVRVAVSVFVCVRCAMARCLLSRYRTTCSALMSYGCYTYRGGSWTVYIRSSRNIAFNIITLLIMYIRQVFK